MSYLLVALVLLGSIVMQGREWNSDRNRMFWFWVLLAFFAAWSIQNPWLAALAALIPLHMFRGQRQLERIMRLDDVFFVIAAFALLSPHVTSKMIVPVLWAIIGLGCWNTVYAVVSWFHYDPEKGYTLEYKVPYLGWTFRFYEHQAHIAAGQGNPNHLHGLCAVTIASAIGLHLLGYPALWFIPALILPMFIMQFTKTNNPGTYTHPQQGWAHLLSLGLAALPLVVGPIGLLPLGIVMIAVAVMLVRNRHHDGGWDSGRALTWWTMIQRWVKEGPITWLIGWGPKEFEPHYTSHCAEKMGETKSFIVAHHPHNEYVIQLLEYGIVGLGLMVGYLVMTAFHLLTGGPEAHALYLILATLCSIAFTSFPWTFYHEIVFRVVHEPPATTNPNPQPATMEARLFTLGTPALFTISFVMVLLIEGVLRG